MAVIIQSQRSNKFLSRHFQGQKVNLNVKITTEVFLANTYKNKWNTSFVCDLTVEYVSGDLLMI